MRSGGMFTRKTKKPDSDAPSPSPGLGSVKGMTSARSVFASSKDRTKLRKRSKKARTTSDPPSKLKSRRLPRVTAKKKKSEVERVLLENTEEESEEYGTFDDEPGSQSGLMAGMAESQPRTAKSSPESTSRKGTGLIPAKRGHKKAPDVTSLTISTTMASSTRSTHPGQGGSTTPLSYSLGLKSLEPTSSTRPSLVSGGELSNSMNSSLGGGSGRGSGSGSGIGGSGLPTPSASGHRVRFHPRSQLSPALENPEYEAMCESKFRWATGVETPTKDGSGTLDSSTSAAATAGPSKGISSLSRARGMISIGSGSSHSLDSCPVPSPHAADHSSSVPKLDMKHPLLSSSDGKGSKIGFHNSCDGDDSSLIDTSSSRGGGTTADPTSIKGVLFGRLGGLFGSPLKRPDSGDGNNSGISSPAATPSSVRSAMTARRFLRYSPQKRALMSSVKDDGGYADLESNSPSVGVPPEPQSARVIPMRKPGLYASASEKPPRMGPSFVNCSSGSSDTGSSGVDSIQSTQSQVDSSKKPKKSLIGGGGGKGGFLKKRKKSKKRMLKGKEYATESSSRLRGPRLTRRMVQRRGQRQMSDRDMLPPAVTTAPLAGPSVVTGLTIHPRRTTADGLRRRSSSHARAQTADLMMRATQARTRMVTKRSDLNEARYRGNSGFQNFVIGRGGPVDTRASVLGVPTGSVVNSLDATPEVEEGYRYRATRANSMGKGTGVGTPSMPGGRESILQSNGLDTSSTPLVGSVGASGSAGVGSGSAGTTVMATSSTPMTTMSGRMMRDESDAVSAGSIGVTPATMKTIIGGASSRPGFGPSADPGFESDIGSVAEPTGFFGMWDPSEVAERKSSLRIRLPSESISSPGLGRTFVQKISNLFDHNNGDQTGRNPHHHLKVHKLSEMTPVLNHAPSTPIGIGSTGGASGSGVSAGLPSFKDVVSSPAFQFPHPSTMNRENGALDIEHNRRLKKRRRKRGLRSGINKAISDARGPPPPAFDANDLDVAASPALTIQREDLAPDSLATPITQPLRHEMSPNYNNNMRSHKGRNNMHHQNRKSPNRMNHNNNNKNESDNNESDFRKQLVVCCGYTQESLELLEEYLHVLFDSWGEQLEMSIHGLKYVLIRFSCVVRAVQGINAMECMQTWPVWRWPALKCELVMEGSQMVYIDGLDKQWDEALFRELWNHQLDTYKLKIVRRKGDDRASAFVHFRSLARVQEAIDRFDGETEVDGRLLRWQHMEKACIGPLPEDMTVQEAVNAIRADLREFDPNLKQLPVEVRGFFIPGAAEDDDDDNNDNNQEEKEMTPSHMSLNHKVASPVDQSMNVSLVNNASSRLGSTLNRKFPSKSLSSTQSLKKKGGKEGDYSTTTSTKKIAKVGKLRKKGKHTKNNRSWDFQRLSFLTTKETAEGDEGDHTHTPDTTAGCAGSVSPPPPPMDSVLTETKSTMKRKQLRKKGTTPEYGDSGERPVLTEDDTPSVLGGRARSSRYRSSTNETTVVIEPMDVSDVTRSNTPSMSVSRKTSAIAAEEKAEMSNTEGLVIVMDPIKPRNGITNSNLTRKVKKKGRKSSMSSDSSRSVIDELLQAPIHIMDAHNESLLENDIESTSGEDDDEDDEKRLQLVDKFRKSMADRISRKISKIEKGEDVGGGGGGGSGVSGVGPRGRSSMRKGSEWSLSLTSSESSVSGLQGFGGAAGSVVTRESAQSYTDSSGAEEKEDRFHHSLKDDDSSPFKPKTLGIGGSRLLKKPARISEVSSGINILIDSSDTSSDEGGGGIAAAAAAVSSAVAPPSLSSTPATRRQGSAPIGGRKNSRVNGLKLGELPHYRSTPISGTTGTPKLIASRRPSSSSVGGRSTALSNGSQTSEFAFQTDVETIDANSHFQIPTISMNDDWIRQKTEPIAEENESDYNTLTASPKHNVFNDSLQSTFTIEEMVRRRSTSESDMSRSHIHHIRQDSSTPIPKNVHPRKQGGFNIFAESMATKKKSSSSSTTAASSRRTSGTSNTTSVMMNNTQHERGFTMVTKRGMSSSSSGSSSGGGVSMMPHGGGAASSSSSASSSPTNSTVAPPRSVTASLRGHRANNNQQRTALPPHIATRPSKSGQIFVFAYLWCWSKEDVLRCKERFDCKPGFGSTEPVRLLVMNDMTEKVYVGNLTPGDIREKEQKLKSRIKRDAYIISGRTLGSTGSIGGYGFLTPRNPQPSILGRNHIHNDPLLYRRGNMHSSFDESIQNALGDESVLNDLKRTAKEQRDLLYQITPDASGANLVHGSSSSMLKKGIHGGMNALSHHTGIEMEEDSLLESLEAARRSRTKSLWREGCLVTYRPNGGRPYAYLRFPSGIEAQNAIERYNGKVCFGNPSDKPVFLESVRSDADLVSHKIKRYFSARIFWWTLLRLLFAPYICIYELWYHVFVRNSFQSEDLKTINDSRVMTRLDLLTALCMFNSKLKNELLNRSPSAIWCRMVLCTGMFSLHMSWITSMILLGYHWAMLKSRWQESDSENDKEENQVDGLEAFVLVTIPLALYFTICCFWAIWTSLNQRVGMPQMHTLEHISMNFNAPGLNTRLSCADFMGMKMLDQIQLPWVYPLEFDRHKLLYSVIYALLSKSPQILTSHVFFGRRKYQLILSEFIALTILIILMFIIICIFDTILVRSELYLSDVHSITNLITMDEINLAHSSKVSTESQYLCGNPFLRLDNDANLYAWLSIRSFIHRKGDLVFSGLEIHALFLVIMAMGSMLVTTLSLVVRVQVIASINLDQKEQITSMPVFVNPVFLGQIFMLLVCFFYIGRLLWLGNRFGRENDDQLNRLQKQKIALYSVRMQVFLNQERYHVEWAGKISHLKLLLSSIGALVQHIETKEITPKLWGIQLNNLKWKAVATATAAIIPSLVYKFLINKNG